MNLINLNGNSLNFKYLFIITHLIPIVTLLICFNITVFYNYTNAIRTHCRNFNYLPSISVITGDFYPQRFISLSLLIIYIGPRLFISYWYHLKFLINRNILKRRFHNVMVYMTFYFNILELIFSFLSICITTSISDFLHVFCFFHVVLFSTLYIIISTILCYMTSATTLKNKQRCMVVYLICISFLLYFNHRHLYYCDVLAFTYFSFYEYVLFFSNYYYHFLAYFELNIKYD